MRRWFQALQEAWLLGAGLRRVWGDFCCCTSGLLGTWSNILHSEAPCIDEIVARNVVVRAHAIASAVISDDVELLMMTLGLQPCVATCESERVSRDMVRSSDPSEKQNNHPKGNTRLARGTAHGSHNH